MISLQEQRALFNATTANDVANLIGVPTAAPTASRSRRFAYFSDSQQFLIVVGPQEGRHSELALALGLTYSNGRRLVLALPEHNCFATQQRAAWLRPESQPEIWLHDGVTANQVAASSTEETIDEVKVRLNGVPPAKELKVASTAIHLDDRSGSIKDLVEWSTKHPDLDGSHRQSERAWHCTGRKVLSIRRAGKALVVTAGIHYSDHSTAPRTPLVLTVEKDLTTSELQQIQQHVEDGIEVRLHGGQLRRDEHWLQAVIRRDPSLVGVEHPALRELPAWRPRDDVEAKRWGRGFVDLLGLDGHGNIRVVETKIADNKDELLVLQGLDYYIWACAYRDAISERIGAHTSAALEIHYVIGASGVEAPKLSPFTQAQVASLHPDLRWRFQTINGWYPCDGTERPTSTLWPVGTLP